MVVDPPCAVISCRVFCGAVFHQCKASEHRILCPMEKVPCINCENGCPIVLQRRNLAQHLSMCPASVVCCTMEWCRWPMYSRERGTRVPFAPSSLRARCGQLDVALALRDQRTLDRAKKFPRRSLIRSLRNSFTKRYPAVPLLVGGNPTFVGVDDRNSEELSLSESEDEDRESNSRAPWLTAKEPPGLQKSILGELFGELPVKSGRNTLATDVRCALCSRPTSEIPPRTSTDGSATKSHVSFDLSTGYTDNGTVCSEAHRPNSPTHYSPNGCGRVIASGSSTRNSDSQGTKHMDIDSQSVAENTSNCSVLRNNTVNDAWNNKAVIGQHSITSRNCSMDTDSCADDRNNQVSEIEPGLTEADPGIAASVVDSGCCLVDSSADQSLALTLHEVLAVDLNIEVCSRYHIHDPSLYSFICAQLFRRDEYMQHVRDVHSVIHDAIDHWLEVRCPLAHCGCTFSMHRRLPYGAKIIFSPLLESLGLRQKDETLDSTRNEPVNRTESSDLVASTESTPMEGMETESQRGSSTDGTPPSERSMAEPTEMSELSVNYPEKSSREMCASVVSTRTQTEYSNTETLRQTKSTAMYENGFKECTPEMFTSREFDSAVFIRPRTSKEPTPSEDAEIMCLTSLPFELLVRIATFLDSFSLCNLSVTSWLLRDVCRSLLKSRGLVVLEWQRDCSRNPPQWKVSHQVCFTFG